MADELPGGESLDWIFQQIAEKNDEEAVGAARKIINTANDRDLRSEFIKLVTDYQTAGDSIKMHEAMEAIVEYAKNQYSLILIQGFRMGQGYQQKVANEAFTTILKNAADGSASDTEGTKTEAAEEPKSDK